MLTFLVAKVRIDSVAVVGVKNVLLAAHGRELGEKQQRQTPRETMARKDILRSITAVGALGPSTQTC